MPLNKLHKMLREALAEIEEEGLHPTKTYISYRYKKPLLDEMAEIIKPEYLPTEGEYECWGVPVEFANLADNIHFYIATEAV